MAGWLKNTHSEALEFSSFRWAWWHTPLIPELQRQANLCEFEASLVYKVRSRTARDTQRIPVLK